MPLSARTLPVARSFNARALFPRLLLLLSCLAVFLLTPPAVMAADPLEIVIIGIEDDVMENVRAALAPPPGLVRDGEINLPWLELFRDEAPERAREALEPFGYYDAKVGAVLQKTGDNRYRLLIGVYPGTPVRVTEMTLQLTGPGADEESLNEMADAFPLRRGDVLLHSSYEEGKALLLAKARDIGFLRASFPTHEIRVSRKDASARVTLILDTGVRYRFGETAFSGAPQYPRRFLERYLDYRVGETYSQERVGQTQINLASSDRFKGVVVTPDRKKAHDDVMPMQVDLSPLPRRRLRPGAGYGTDTGFRGSLIYKDVNVFLLGHEWNTEINISQRLQGLASRYTIPGSRDINSSTSFQANFQREKTDTYTDRLIFQEVSWSRSFLRGQLLTLFLRTQQEDYTVSLQQSSAFLVLPGVRFSQRYLDNPVRPTKGYSFSLEAKGTHQYLGSSTGLLQIIAAGHAIAPLPWRFSLSSRIKAGVTFQNEPLKDLPASLRFFAGGDRSVRGYAYQSLGPKDITGKVIGGKDLLVGSVELDRALFKDWGVAAFYDVGNSFNSLNRIRLYQGAGLGVRYYTPIGALQLDVARQIGVDNPAFRVHFTVGIEL